MDGNDRRGQTARRGLAVAAAVALAALATLAGGPGRALAAPAQAAPPTVTLDWSDGVVREDEDCKGVERNTEEQALQFAVYRTGDTSAPLEVPLTFSGSLAGAPGLSSPVTIPAGSSEVAVTPEGVIVGDDLTVEVQPDADYAIGDPGRGTATMSGVPVDRACGAGATGNEQTVTLGSQPKPFDVEEAGWFPPPHWPRSIEGDIPPGTQFFPNGTFSGATTQLGTFRFRMDFCDDDGWCPYRANLTVHVVPATGGTVPPAAPPAAPVASAPSYTG